jgi:hypothetical protein
MGAAGRARVLARFSGRVVVQRLIGVLHAVEVRRLAPRRLPHTAPPRVDGRAETLHPAV